MGWIRERGREGFSQRRRGRVGKKAECCVHINTKMGVKNVDLPSLDSSLRQIWAAMSTFSLRMDPNWVSPDSIKKFPVI